MRAAAARKPATAGSIAAVLVRQAARRNTNQPSGRVVRLPLRGPRGGGGKQRFLHGILGVSEIAIAAHQRTEDLRRQFTQQVLGAHGGRHTSGSGALSTWRTSIGWRIATPPGPGAADA